MAEAAYIHGTDPAEQARLAKLGELTDAAFAQFVETHPADYVLDVGSGLGNVARRIATAVPQGSVRGVEKSPEQLSKALQHELPNLHFQAGDAHALPFAADTFDVVYCRYLLEHVAEPVKVLTEMRRVLKPGGRVFVQENNTLIHVTDPDCPRFEHLWRRFAEMQRQLGGDGEIGKRLFRLLSEGGLRDVQPSMHAEVHAAGMATYRPWLENLMAIIRYAQVELLARHLATADEICDGIAELESLRENPAGCAYFYWNRASGSK